MTDVWGVFASFGGALVNCCLFKLRPAAATARMSGVPRSQLQQPKPSIFSKCYRQMHVSTSMSGKIDACKTPIAHTQKKKHLDPRCRLW